MSKEGRARGSKGPSDKSPVPYSTITRRERSRKLAQKRRDVYKKIMDDMTDVMPFPKDVVSQLDYNSRLRLTICFFKMKTMLRAEEEEEDGLASTLALEDPGCSEHQEDSRRLAVSKARPSLFKQGMLQDLMCEALDGFLMVTQLDGTIVFLSESIHKHLGLFQSEHIGINLYDLILEDDHEDVQRRLSEADDLSVKRKTKHGTTEVSFFCRMKCSRFKLANASAKSPGFKLVYVSGTMKVVGDEPFIACVVRPVSPPSILELRMEGNMFVAHYSMEFSCIYFDGRLRHLLGYTKEDFLGKSPFSFQHHDDIEATMRCSMEVQRKGEGVSGYYRFLNRFGEYIWIQSRAVLVCDSCTGKPSHIVCTSYVISKEDGNKDLLLRQAIASGQSEFIEKNLAPENSFALKKQVELHKNNTIQNKEDPTIGSLLASKLKRQGPTSSSTSSNSSSSTGDKLKPSSSASSTSTGNKKTSILYSMLSNKPLSPLQTRTYASSTAHADVIQTEEADSSECRSISSSLSSSKPSVSVEMEDGNTPDSAVCSNDSSPYDPASVLPDERTSRVSSVHMTHVNDRTMSGSDLGYHSESCNSLRDRMVSNFNGYESETSTYAYENGADTSPPNPYSPDYPLSILSSDGSMTSRVSFLATSPADSHSSSLFCDPSSIRSVLDEAVESPSYFMPMDESDLNDGYTQQSPCDPMTSKIMLQSTVGVQQQWSPGSSVSSPPQNFSNGQGEAPVNYSPSPLRMDPVISVQHDVVTNGSPEGFLGAGSSVPPQGFSGVRTAVPPQGFSGGRTMPNRNLPPMGFQYTGGASSSHSFVASQQRVVHSISSSSSLMFSEVFVTSVANGSSPPMSIQATVNSSNVSKGVNSDLPQLTVEDLNVLDAFEPSKEDDQLGQLLHQQTALSCRGTMMM